MRLDRESLRALYPPMDAEFERDTRQMIRSLPLKEDIKMKKKTGAAFALACLLIALTATALAAYAVSQGFFADVARIQLQGGAYDGWKLEEKEEVVRLMKEYGMLSDASAWDAAMAEPDGEKREAALDKLFAERYGINGRTDVITVDSMMEREKGPFAEWSMEDKAWYSALMADVGLLGSDAEYYLLPDDGAISAQEAEQAAREAVIAAYKLDANALDGYTAWVDCREHVSEVGVKPPYYGVELHGEQKGERWYWVCVSQDGRVLTSEDGYVGVTSPAEDVAQQERQEALKAVPEEERLAAHTQGLTAMDARVVEISQDAMIQDMITLRDGSLLIIGFAGSADGMLEGLTIRGKTPFALCMDEQGTVRWKAALDFEARAEAAMELEDGSVLILTDDDLDDVTKSRFRQTRIGADGTVGETVCIPLTEEMVGIRCEYEQFWGRPGHGGFFIRGVAGGQRTDFCVQLDAQGQPVFAHVFDELQKCPLEGYATSEGYVIVAWNEAANKPLLRWLDKEGNTLREVSQDEAMTGMRITGVLPQADGSITVTSRFTENGERWLAQIGADGTVTRMDKATLNMGRCTNTSDIVRMDGGYAILNDHFVSVEDSTIQHAGLVVFGDDGTIAERRLIPLEEIENQRGRRIIAGIGAGKIAVAVNVLEEYTEDWSYSRNSCRVIIVDP